MLGAVEYVDHFITTKERGRKRRPKELKPGYPYDSTISNPGAKYEATAEGKQVNVLNPLHNQKHQELLIFSECQAYPEFVLEYS